MTETETETETETGDQFKMQPRQSDLDHLAWLRTAGVPSLAGKRVLDLGCGSGYICETAAAEGASLACGIDVVWPELGESPKWRFLERDLDGGEWAEGLGEDFDYVFGFDILEHLESPYAFLRACHRILRDGGTLFLTTPNLSSWERWANPRNWSGATDPQHKILFNRYSLDFVLKRAGFARNTLSAPIRSLKMLGPWQPHLGGQIFCQAAKTEHR